MIRPVQEQFPVTDSFERACDGDNAFDVRRESPEKPMSYLTFARFGPCENLV